MNELPPTKQQQQQQQKKNKFVSITVRDPGRKLR